MVWNPGRDNPVLPRWGKGDTCLANYLLIYRFDPFVGCLSHFLDSIELSKLVSVGL